MGPHDLHEEWLQQSTSPKQHQETPATPVFYSVGGAEDVGCYTGENLPQDAQQRIGRQRRRHHHHTSLSDGAAQVDALSRLLSARAKQNQPKKMNHYIITLGTNSECIMRAKTAQNALVNWLRLLSATHHIPRGAYAEARRITTHCGDSYASVYLWRSKYGMPVFAAATKTAKRQRRHTRRASRAEETGGGLG